MSLRLEPGSPKRYRPKAGQIFLMKTSAGYVPVGVTSTEAFFGACVMIHPYRALVHDITDTSYYSLIEKNELLIPPVMVPKPDFSKGGYFTKNSDKNAPAPIPFDKYYFYVGATSWNPHELGFSPTTGAFPYDRLPDFDPIDERRIECFLHDSNPPVVEKVDQAPEGTYFMYTYGIPETIQLDFAIEDTLAYYGLIDTPRPPHADFSDIETASAHAERPKPMTPEQFLHLADIEGTSTLFAAMDQTPEQVVEAITEAGHEPNGYFFEGLATYLINLHDLDGAGIEADSEAGMFSLLGNSATVTALHEHLLGLLRNPAELTQTIQQAEAAGHDFDD